MEWFNGFFARTSCSLLQLLTIVALGSLLPIALGSLLPFALGSLLPVALGSLIPVAGRSYNADAAGDTRGL